MSKKVGIVYGWAEGHGHAKYIRLRLRDEGFQITRKLDEADIIIAHSGGIFLLPSTIKAKLVLLVGVPYWPGRHPSKSLRRKVKLELKSLNSKRYLLRKTCFNVLYFISKPLHHYKIWRAWKVDAYPLPHDESSFIAVRNKHDPFTDRNKMTDFAGGNNWNVVSLDGYHDDLWLNPDKYIQLIKASLAQL